jgi:hypothetical protein
MSSSELLRCVIEHVLDLFAPTIFETQIYRSLPTPIRLLINEPRDYEFRVRKLQPQCLDESFPDKLIER